MLCISISPHIVALDCGRSQSIYVTPGLLLQDMIVNLWRDRSADIWNLTQFADYLTASKGAQDAYTELWQQVQLATGT